MGREKRDHSSGQLSRLPQILKKRTLRGGGLILYMVVLLVAVS